MGRTPRPLAVGLVQLSSAATESERRQLRIALALRANEEGYALVETYELEIGPQRREQTYQAFDDIATRLNLYAVLTSGQVDNERVEKIAERVRMIVIPTF